MDAAMGMRRRPRRPPLRVLAFFNALVDLLTGEGGKH
jgi:hypothetical protein